jgi:hypothetical protein
VPWEYGVVAATTHRMIHPIRAERKPFTIRLPNAALAARVHNITSSKGES